MNSFVQKSEEVRPGTGPAGAIPAVRQINPAEAAGIEGFADFAPSWQNSHESVSRVPEHFVALGAFKKEKLTGYVHCSARGQFLSLIGT